MLRDTMINTMPVAMMAIDALCTERFQRLREVRNAPSESRWKPTQITMSAAIIPARRVSISVEARTDRQSRREVAGDAVDSAARVSLMLSVPHTQVKK